MNELVATLISQVLSNAPNKAMTLKELAIHPQLRHIKPIPLVLAIGEMCDGCEINITYKLKMKDNTITEQSWTEPTQIPDELVKQSTDLVTWISKPQ